MIPSLVVTEIRSALVEYLASTFALADEDVRDALSAFLEDEADGIFRGPYLKVRTPFRSVDPGWRSPLDWLPDWFVPHARQARSFERLASKLCRRAPAHARDHRNRLGQDRVLPLPHPFSNASLFRTHARSSA